METIFQKMKKQFEKVSFIKQSIANGMTLEQAIAEYKNQNQ
jgi:hypothetical protein